MERREFFKYFGMSTVLLGLSPRVFAGMLTERTNNGICEEAWVKLCANRIKEAPYAYVEPQKKLPNVLIYGDSISIGYTLSTRKDLEGKANVFRIHKNGQSSGKFIPTIEAMRKGMFQPYLQNGWNFKWDVIHFNVGLHDLKYLFQGKLDLENGKQVSTIEKYKANLHKICDYLQEEYPKATLIFATTTPVPEGADGRVAGDSVRYNKAALEVLQDYPTIKINDLYNFTKPNFDEWTLNPGNVHYNEEGRQAQGKEVAEFINKYL